jgi:hypothetical protein
VKNNNNILDNYLQEKVDAANFELDEAHWQHALNALQQEDDDKKPIIWWRMLLLGIAILATGIGAYLFTNKNTSPAISQVSPNTTTNNNITKPTEIDAATELKVVKEPSDNIIVNKNTTPKATINNNTALTTNTTNEPQAITPAAVNTSTMATKVGTNNKKKYYTNIAKTTNNIDTVSNTPTETISKINNATASLQTITPEPSKAKQIINNIKTKINNIVFGTKAPTDVIAKNNTTAPVIAKSKKLTATKAKPELLKVNNTSNISNEKSVVTMPIANTLANQNTTTTSKAVLSPNEQQQLNKRYVKGLNNYEQKQKATVKVDTIMITAASATKPIFAPILNNNNTSTTNTVTPGNAKLGKPSLMLNVSASIAKAPINIYNNVRAYTINPWLSCGFYFPISNKLSVQTMLGFTYLSGLSFEYSAYKTRYNFGVDTSTYKLINKTMYQLYTPITIGYQIAPKQQIFAGGGIIYGINMLNAEKNYNSNVYTKTWGYTDAYKQLDAFATLAYQYQLLKNMYAQFSYIQGFADITKNSVQANTITDRNSRFQIGVNIKLK